MTLTVQKAIFYHTGSAFTHSTKVVAMPDPESEDDLTIDDTRRAFIKQGVKGAMLLSYVTPAIESVFLSTADAEDDDDDDSGGSSGSGAKGVPPSQLGNTPPPPTNSSTNSSSNSGDDDKKRRKPGEPPPPATNS